MVRPGKSRRSISSTTPEELVDHLDSDSNPPRDAGRRTRLLLGIGAVLGGLLAAIGLMAPAGPSESSLPKNVIAVVNGDFILRADYERLLAGFAQDSRNPIDDEARQHVLDRMIDEELLVQRALELGLAQVDRRVRAGLTSSLIASVVSTAEDHDPTADELRSFYQDESEFFSRPGRLRVKQILFRIPNGEDEGAVLERAQLARESLLAGRSFEEVDAEYGDEQISPLPDTLLPALKIREYIGPSALQTAMALTPGEISQPVRSGIGLHLLGVVDATPSVTPNFEEIESQVRNEWVRRAGDRALRDYLDQLRDDGDVQIQSSDSS